MTPLSSATSQSLLTRSAPHINGLIATRPAPVTRTTTATPARSRRFEISRRLDFRHAGRREVLISGEWCGPDDAPAVLVAGGISADRHVVSSPRYSAPGWWQALAGPHRALDPTRHRLIAIDWLGIEGNLDVPIDSADQAAAITATLDHLGISRAAAFVGASYGGMVGLQLAALFPERVARLVVISAAHRSHPYASAWRGIQRRILELGGDSDAGLSLARQLAMLSYRTPAEFAERFTDPPVVEGSRVGCTADTYLEACGSRFVERFHPTAWRRLSESIDLHRVDPAGIRIPTTAIAVAEDRLVARADIAELVARLGGKGELQVISSKYGHDAFLKEPVQIGQLVGKALADISAGVA